VFGMAWLPAQLLEIRNGVGLVQIGEFHTVRSLEDICRADGPERRSEEMDILPGQARDRGSLSDRPISPTT
jgi:hypothetical protein